MTDVVSRSDSSMDDCNVREGDCVYLKKMVQIPLWTIVTTGAEVAIDTPIYGSDSSMDDCNGLSRS